MCLLASIFCLCTACGDDSEPKPAPDPKYDLDITAKHALGSLGAPASEGGPSRFVMALSDIAIEGSAAAPQFAAAGSFVSLNLYAVEAAAGGGILPEGTYSFVGGDPADKQASLKESFFGTTDASGQIVGKTTGFTKATATVTRSGAGYKIELTATLADARTLSCTYEGAIDFRSEGPQYDVDFTANYALGSCYSQVMEDGSSNFYISLSDIEMEGDAENPIFGQAGSYVLLDLYAIELEEGILPEGTYPFVATEPIDKQASLDFSGYGTTDASGEMSDGPILFLEGEVAVSYTDDGYRIDVTATLEDARTFHCTYEGMLEFLMEGGGDVSLPGLESDVNTSFVLAKARYFGPTDAAELYILDLYDVTDAESMQTNNRLSLTIFTSPSDEGLGIAPGDYTISPAETAGTMLPGKLDMQTIMVSGCYCEQTVYDGEDYKMLYGLVTGGSVKVEKSAGGYTVTANLTDKDGHTIKGSYSGTIEFIDESYFSTLEGDVTVNVAGMPCDAEYYAGYFGANSDNWTVFIGTGADNSEALQIELLAPVKGFSGGLPTGEYTVGSGDNYQDGTYVCVPGITEGFNLYFSWYLGDLMGGSAYTIAPFDSGKVTVSKTNDQYTIAVDVYDDCPSPNKITASWTGKPTMIDKSSSQSAMQNRMSKSAVRQTAKVVPAPKSAASHPVTLQKGAARHRR